MSHYSVLVVTKGKPEYGDIERILAPYDENLSVAPYIGETAEQYLKNKRKNLEEYKNKGPYAEYLKDPVAYESKYGHNPHHLEYVKNFMTTYNMSDEELLRVRYEEYAHEPNEDEEPYIDKDGNYITTYNPKSKWDWWVIGGRFSGSLVTKTGDEVNCGQVKDIDFGQDIDYEHYKQDKELVREYNHLITEGDFYKPEYYKETYPSIEHYIKAIKQYSSFAFVNEEGEWFEKGEMGWFGMSSDTAEDRINWVDNYYENLIKKLDENWYVTVVDCHI